MLKNLYQQSFFNIEIGDVDSSHIKNVAKAVEKLRSEIIANSLPAINIINQAEDLKLYQKLSEKIKKFSKVILLGVGGSSLGAKTICSLKANHQIEFLESIDPNSIDNVLNQLKLEQCFFLVISKSGETVETICQTLIILKKLQFKKEQGKNINFDQIAQQFLFITANKTSSIAKIAKQINAEIIDHHPQIGGRYSVFSVVGILPAIIADLDAIKFRQGAKKVVELFLAKDDFANYCAIQLQLYQKGFHNNVFMPYLDNLKNFTDWYRQLLAESLGKNGFGATPINSMGTVDQHSQLQLYLEGNHDKFFTFIGSKKTTNDFLIEDLENCQTLFGNKNLSEILAVEKNTTIEVLKQKKLPIRIFEFDQLDEESLGALMMQMFLEIIIIAYANNIDPFDQPAVELRKNLAKKILLNFKN